MSKKVIHPGLLLDKLLNERSISQRDLASRIDVAHSLLNSILKGHRSINTNIAISLETAGYEEASYWLVKQMEYNLHQAQNDDEVIKKRRLISEWNEVGEVVPLHYLKKQNVGINSSDDVEKVFNIYNVNSLKELKNKINNFSPTYFRKSSKFLENKNNVLAWSLLAEHKLKSEKINIFSRDNEDSLISELNKCFYKNNNVINESKKILNKYGIKFLVLDRPSHTPVDGKSFISGQNPAIALSLKYKRLDNFAFTLFHEIGHVFEHLTNSNRPEFRDAEFFVDNSSKTELVEFEADKYATEKLIDVNLFNDFLVMNHEYTDDVIIHFSKTNKVHPGIVRGRVCYHHNEYYRKRSSITLLNKLNAD